jgi:iron complex outermembrane recepter protein
MLLAALCALPLAPARAQAPPPVAAAAAEVDFHVGAGPLDQALTEFAHQSRVQILFDTRLVQQHRSAGVRARLPVREGLRMLLGGSGLSAEQVNANTYVLKAHALAPPRRAPRAEPGARANAAATTELSAVQVTGSLVRRASLRGVAPVSVITREQIERSGLRSVVDLLRTQPSVDTVSRSEIMASQPAFNYLYGGATGAATLGMRGLGSRATLLLIDGRRIASYGLTQAGAGAVVDVGDIPLDLVERIEILRDGASVLYGADAIGGVINIILRKSFDGQAASVDYGVSGNGDAQRYGASATLGGQSGPGTLFLHASGFRRDPLLGSQRDWYTRDRRGEGLPDLRTPYSFPGTYIYFDRDGSAHIAPMPGCAAADISGSLCLLDEAKYTTLQTEQSGKALFLRAAHTVDETLELYSELRVAQLAQQQQAAPIAFGILLPPGNPSNPAEFGPALVYYSFSDIGPVRESTRATTRAFNLGAHGLAGDYEWNAAFSLQSNGVVDYIAGLVNPNSVLRRLESGEYILGGDNPRRVLDALSPRLQRRGNSAQAELAASASGPLTDLPGGAALLTFGAEVRRQRFTDEPDPLLRSEDRPFGNRSFVQRAIGSVAAAYAQVELPFTPAFSAEAGWRLDYSRDIATANSPRLGLRWQPVESLLLRATAAKGFRAPTPLELHQPTLFNGIEQVPVPATLQPCAQTDPLAPGECRLEVITRGNSQLRPETSRGHTLGMVLTLGQRASLSVDFFSIRRSNEVTTLPIAYALSHAAEFPDLLRRDKEGRLSGININLVNLGRTDTRGIDLGAQWQLADGASRLVARLDATYALRRDVRFTDDAGTTRFTGHDSNPRARARLGLDWTRGAWSLTANTTFVDAYRNTLYAGDTLGCVDQSRSQRRCRTPAFATVDLTGGYTAAHWSIKLGIQNAFDRKPVYYGSNSANYNIYFDDPVGRFYSVQAGYRF